MPFLSFFSCRFFFFFDGPGCKSYHDIEVQYDERRLFFFWREWGPPLCSRVCAVPDAARSFSFFSSLTTLYCHRAVLAKVHRNTRLRKLGFSSPMSQECRKNLRNFYFEKISSALWCRDKRKNRKYTTLFHLRERCNVGLVEICRRWSWNSPPAVLPYSCLQLYGSGFL